MPDATITTEDIQGSKPMKIVKVSGQLDESNVDERIKTVYAILEGNTGVNLIFDFENLEYMNSKSIGYLTDIYGKVKEKGGDVVIAKAKPNILDILQVVGLTQLIKNFDTTDMAKAALESATPATPTPASEAAPTTTSATEQPTPPPAVS